MSRKPSFFEKLEMESELILMNESIYGRLDSLRNGTLISLVDFMDRKRVKEQSPTNYEQSPTIFFQSHGNHLKMQGIWREKILKVRPSVWVSRDFTLNSLCF